MTASQLIAFNLTLLAGLMSPGPALLMLVRTSVIAGRTAGILTGCGLATMAALATLIALFGLGAVFRLVPDLYLVAKVAGAAYLVVIAVRIFRHARDEVEAKAEAVRRDFVDGFLLNLFNPKLMMFATAVLIVIFPARMPASAKLFAAFNHLVVEVVVYAVLATVLARPAVSRRYLAAKVYFDRTAAVVLFGLAARLLFDL